MKLLWISLLVVACGGQNVAAVTVAPLPQTSASVAPVALDHPPTVNAFLEAGCKVAAASDPTQLDCKAAHVDGIAACHVPVHVLSVSFDPPATVADCFVEGDRTSGLRQAGCMLPMRVRLIAATRHGFVWIDSPEALAKEFAPVGSRDEAIAFAVALTGAQVVKPTDPEAKNLGATDVRADGDGFRVKLFTTTMCGCHHPTNAIEYAVTREGAVHEADRKEVWSDPQMNGMCVD